MITTAELETLLLNQNYERRSNYFISKRIITTHPSHNLLQIILLTLRIIHSEHESLSSTIPLESPKVPPNCFILPFHLIIKTRVYQNHTTSLHQPLKFRRGLLHK